MDIEQLSHELKYENKWMKVYEDKIKRRDDTAGIYGVVEKPEFFLIIPFDGENVYLVEQYRYPLKVRTLEFPQGGMEKKDEDSLAGAVRELREETGLSAGFIKEIGSIYTAVGFSNQTGNVFFAKELIQGTDDKDAEESDLIVKKVSVADFEKMIERNEIKDSGTLSAWCLAKAKKFVH